MKRILITLLASFASIVFAEGERHTPGGPTGGRLITKVEPHVEFFVNKDNKIEIRFFDDANVLVAPGDQLVSVIMGDRSAPTKLAFAKEGDKLVSDREIPEGDALPTVVQIKLLPGGPTVLERFNLDLSSCPTCEFKEYACICKHDSQEQR